MKFILYLFSVLMFFSACSEGEHKAAVQTGIKYTCSMHPEVLKDEPGKCPICHMDLVPNQQTATPLSPLSMHQDSAENMQMDTTSRQKTRANEPTMPNEIELTSEQIRLANIQVDTTGHSGFGSSMVLTGTVAINEKNVAIISARVKGRIDRLYYKNIGDFIPAGAKVYDLYSEELNSAKQEYLLLLQRSKAGNSSLIVYNDLLQAARHKLLLWGMTTGQISAIEKAGHTSYTTSFYSNASGYIGQLNVTEGNYVMEGNAIIRLANTSSVWVETQVYTSQLSSLNLKGNVTVHLPQMEGKKLVGTIEFASPEINSQTRINLLRVNIPNPGNQLKPGMAAYVYVTNTQSKSMVLPRDAVMRNGNMVYVWVKTGDRKFGMQVVKLGAENGNQVEIIEGIETGSVVVTSGAYLLNSEYLLRNGSNSMEGMKM